MGDSLFTAPPLTPSSTIYGNEDKANGFKEVSTFFFLATVKWGHDYVKSLLYDVLEVLKAHLSLANKRRNKVFKANIAKMLAI